MTDTLYNQNKTDRDAHVDEHQNETFDVNRDRTVADEPVVSTTGAPASDPYLDQDRVADAQWADESPATSNVGDLPPVPEAAPHDPALADDRATVQEDGTLLGTDRRDGDVDADPVLAPAPVASDSLREHSLDGDPNHHGVDSDSEVIRVKHLDGEDDKPWTIEFVNVGALKKARAILNYPVHRFETEEKANEVAQMLAEIIKADAVVEADGDVDPVTEDEKAGFFHNLKAPDKL